jgi:hypothetical protein
MEFVGTDTVPFRGLLELINMHKPELLKIVDVETLYSLDILQGKPCVIDGNFEFLSFNLNTAQDRHGRFLVGKTATMAAASLVCRYCCHKVLYFKSRQDCGLAGLTCPGGPGTK